MFRMIRIYQIVSKAIVFVKIYNKFIPDHLHYVFALKELPLSFSNYKIESEKIGKLNKLKKLKK